MMSDPPMSIENELVEAAMKLRQEDYSSDVNAVVRRARRHIGVTDALSFGFGELLSTVLTILSGVFRQCNTNRELKNQTDLRNH